MFILLIGLSTWRSDKPLFRLLLDFHKAVKISKEYCPRHKEKPHSYLTKTIHLARDRGKSKHYRLKIFIRKKIEIFIKRDSLSHTCIIQ